MRRALLASCILFPALAFAQNAPTVGDVYQSGSPQPVEQSYQKLYQLAAEITNDPSFDYQQAHADTTNWPDIAKAQAQWDTAMGQSGNALTQDERSSIVPCVAHLNAAIDDEERGYLIQVTQPSNSGAQTTAQTLISEGKAEFAKCLLKGAVTANGTPPGTGAGGPGETSGSGPTNGGSPGGNNGQPPINGGGGTPGGNPVRSPGGSPGGPPSSGGPGNGAGPTSGSGGGPGSGGGVAPSDPDMANQFLLDAQTLLQNAGRISKSMTDAMDVTKHNNVGISVALMSAFGAIGKGIGLAAQQYKALAVAGAVAQDAPLLQMGGAAATESGVMANEVSQLESQIASSGAAGMAQDIPAFMEDAVIESTPNLPPQGALPTCTVLACARLSQLLGRNTQLMEVFEKIKPNIRLETSPTGEVYAAGGLTPSAVASALDKIGIKAQVEKGMEAMMDTVRAGNPVIGNVFTAGPGSGSAHALVVEGIETRGTVEGLQIYDPMGFNFWQPASTFEKHFTGLFIKPL